MSSDDMGTNAAVPDYRAPHFIQQKDVSTAHDIDGRLTERASSAAHGHCEFCGVDLNQFGHGNDCVVHLLDDAVDEIRRLRGEVAELLPWAEAAANDRLTVSIGDVYWPAQELRDRIDAGEFGSTPLTVQPNKEARRG